MRGKHLLEKMSFIDYKWVKEAETEKKNNHKLRRALITAAAAVACVAIAVSIAVGVFVNSQAFVLLDLAQFATTEQVLYTKELIIEGHLMEYRKIRPVGMQKQRLAESVGDLLMTTENGGVYRFAGRDDLVYLIFDEDGELTLGEFFGVWYHTSYDAIKDDLDRSYFSLLFTEEQLKTLTALSSPEELYRIIYHIHSAEDIHSVIFKKTNADNTNRGRSVKVKTVTLTDRDDIAEFYHMLCTLDVPLGLDWITPSTEKIAERYASLRAQDIPGNQVDRVILVKLKSGYVIEMRYDGEMGTLQSVGRIRSPLSDEVNDWIIEHAEIDFSYQGYATDKVITGAETMTMATTPPNTAAPEPTPE